MISSYFLVVRQYTNAKRLFIETNNRLIASKLFARIRADEEDADIKKVAYEKLISAIVDSPYNQQSSEDSKVAIYNNLLKQLKNEK